jgi:pyruvate dehydrogenase E2 component (dihydrolipoamide acetyltransferase)
VHRNKLSLSKHGSTGEGRSVAEIKQVLVPDIGDFKNIPIIELLVRPGDKVKIEDPLIS